MTTERDIRNQIAFAKDKGFEEGREEGFEDGIEKGREKGREEGREEGRVEERERIITALRNQGVSEEIIVKVSESKR